MPKSARAFGIFVGAQEPAPGAGFGRRPDAAAEVDRDAERGGRAGDPAQVAVQFFARLRRGRRSRRVAPAVGAVDWITTPSWPTPTQKPLASQCMPKIVSPSPADGPTADSLHRGDVLGQVLTVQRVAHLGAQGVAGGGPSRAAAERLGRGEQRVPDARRVLGGHQELVAALPGVAGAAHAHRSADARSAVAARGHVVEGHVVHAGEVGGAGQHGDEHLGGLRTLHGEHGEFAVAVGDAHPGRGGPCAASRPPGRRWRRWARQALHPVRRGRR